MRDRVKQPGHPNAQAYLHAQETCGRSAVDPFTIGQLSMVGPFWAIFRRNRIILGACHIVLAVELALRGC